MLGKSISYKWMCHACWDYLLQKMKFLETSPQKMRFSDSFVIVEISDDLTRVFGDGLSALA